MNRIAAVLAEVWRIVLSQRVASVVVLLLVAGQCVGVLLTTGRTVAAEQAVLARLDAAGTRSLVIRATSAQAVPAGTLNVLAASEGVQEVTGLGPIEDATNAQVPGGPPIPIRRGYGTIGGRSMVESETHLRIGRALLSDEAAGQVGFLDGVGGLLTTSGNNMQAVKALAVPDYLQFTEPLGVLPSSTRMQPSGEDPQAPLTLIVVICTSPPDVASVEALARSMLSGGPSDGVTVETSAQLAQVRAAVGGELGSYGRSTVLGVLGLGLVLVGVSLAALMNQRRRDFGRRRALGASQSLIMTLVLAQVGLIATLGAIFGTALTSAWLDTQAQELPDTQFVVAVAIASIISALAAATAPAIVAARREPLQELRVA